jgi:two-component system response regulator ChvI
MAAFCPAPNAEGYMKVVVVESDREMLAFLQLLLVAGGHDPRPFADGANAIIALPREEPDVLLSDLALARVQGESVARAAAALPRPPRIVLMSGDAARLARAHALADAVMEKPFHGQELLDMLKRWDPGAGTPGA